MSLNWKDIEEACKIEPKKDYRIGFFVLLFIFILLLLPGCTTLEVGVHYSKMAYNKCYALDNWQCLWYDE